MLASGRGAGCGDAAGSVVVCLAALWLPLPPVLARARRRSPLLRALRRAAAHRRREAPAAGRARRRRRLRRPLDGAWGAGEPGGDRGLRGARVRRRPLNAHAAALVLAFREEVEANGWHFRHDPDLGLSLALPLAALGPSRPRTGGRRWWSRQGTLTVLLHRFDADEARGLARRAARRQRPAGGARRCGASPTRCSPAGCSPTAGASRPLRPGRRALGDRHLAERPDEAATMA